MRLISNVNPKLDLVPFPMAGQHRSRVPLAVLPAHVMSLSVIDHSLDQLLHVKLIFIYKFNVLLSVGIIICDHKFLVNNQSRPGPARPVRIQARPGPARFILSKYQARPGPARPGPARPGPRAARPVPWSSFCVCVYVCVFRCLVCM
jgi:hypothetical protein